MCLQILQDYHISIKLNPMRLYDKDTVIDRFRAGVSN